MPCRQHLTHLTAVRMLNSNCKIIIIISDKTIILPCPHNNSRAIDFADYCFTVFVVYIGKNNDNVGEHGFGFP